MKIYIDIIYRSHTIDSRQCDVSRVQPLKTPIKVDITRIIDRQVMLEREKLLDKYA